MATTRTEVPGVIRSGEVYTLPELCARMRWGEWALRKAREDGLKLRKQGLRKYAIGSDVIDFMETRAVAP